MQCTSLTAAIVLAGSFCSAAVRAEDSGQKTQAASAPPVTESVAAEHQAKSTEPSHAVALHPGKLHLGASLNVLASSNYGEKVKRETLIGGGLFFKYEVHEHVTIGIVPGVFIVPARGSVKIPIDLMIEFPLHIGSAIFPYYGLGPSISIIRQPDYYSDGTDTVIQMGVVAVAGMEFWLSNKVGLFLEMNFNNYFSVDENPVMYNLQAGASIGVIVAP